MDTPTPPPQKTRPWVAVLIVLVLGFDLAFLWQHMGDAYHSEFGAHPDEAAHVVTGLFVRDSIGEGFRWAREGFHGSPVTVGKAFADDYYAHYPKIGRGIL